MDSSFQPETRTYLMDRSRSVSAAASFVLIVADGPDKGGRFVLDAASPSRVLTGTSSSCGIRLSDPCVSRRHAGFDVVGPRLRLTDLGSSNGTFVNGIAIVEVLLDGGEFVRLGETVIHVQREERDKEVALSPKSGFGHLIGESEEMRRLYPLCERLAASDVPVLIEGETGCGKEVLAEAIHDMSARATEPFVVFDCLAAPPNLLEAALFGHEKGAYTGATASQPGVFERAHRGTLLIDEIGDLDLSLQPKLLRSVQRGEVQRVGGVRPIKVDVRILSATRRNLDEEVQKGRFRDDLYFRLNVARVELPPLRHRRGDVTLLARHFWSLLGGERVAPIAPNLLERLEAYSWPGNVRELYNTIARHIALGEFADAPVGGARLSQYPPAMPAEPATAAADVIDEVIGRRLPLPEARQQIMEEFERRYLDAALATHGGNVTKAAAASGVGRRYFHILRARTSK